MTRGATALLMCLNWSPYDSDRAIVSSFIEHRASSLRRNKVCDVVDGDHTHSGKTSGGPACSGKTGSSPDGADQLDRCFTQQYGSEDKHTSDDELEHVSKSHYSTI